MKSYLWAVTALVLLADTSGCNSVFGISVLTDTQDKSEVEGGGADATVEAPVTVATDASSPDAPEEIVVEVSAPGLADSQPTLEAEASWIIDSGPDETPVEDAGAESLPDAEAGPDPSDHLPRFPILSRAQSPRLWLTADLGLICDQGRVTRWRDLSGNGNDATLKLGQLGPRCQLSTAPHVVNGIDIPFFSAPIDRSNLIDETLDVDLGFLAQNDYTIFVVERRWKDLGFILGTTAPDQTVLNCQDTTDQDEALQFGYVDYGSGNPLSLVIDQTCDGVRATVLPVPVPPPARLGYDTTRFGVSFGHQIWIDGSLLINSENLRVPLKVAQGGAIGRAFVNLASTGLDSRFIGDIAEVIVFDTALVDEDRITMEQYLKAHWGL
jgi:hypothetical protein